ncbi:MAG: imidazoleglycerol-phosphate dehydratase HisB [Actinomycetota bacterium]|nr:imidazoleglycerol-phosphate dehydratase HisB [Sporichthyaceae bacterium]MDQ3113399.1 imidazoleglycerol-phosphate dehydratase HisB [Actinomycetota bacterium]MDQ3449696.1 imidazoleglycerol-phosphate dehydratase HisB [Actinomycetota bacterium]
MSRTGRVERSTSESRVLVELDLDGTGVTRISTGVGFYDHMLDSFARHGLFDLRVQTEGDVQVDPHHSVEDTAIALGSAVRQALGDRSGIRRFGTAFVPLDEALTRAVVDLSGRPYLVHHEPAGLAPMIGAYETSLTRHVWEAFSVHAAICLHVDVERGRNAHHVAETQFKAVARALRMAAEPDPRETGVPSTKGTLTA